MFSRQKIAEAIALRFDGAGLADVLAHAPLPATPLRWASVGRFSFGEIGIVRPVIVTFPFSTVAGGSSRPFVPSAVTTPPPGDCVGVDLAALSPAPPPPHPAINAIAPNATIRRIRQLCPFRQVLRIGCSA